LVNNKTQQKFVGKKAEDKENSPRILILDSNELSDITDSTLLKMYYDCCEMVTSPLVLKPNTLSLEDHSMSLLKHSTDIELDKSAEKLPKENFLWSLNV
jgi:hypothetical protein